jgi:hypothetical protein
MKKQIGILLTFMGIAIMSFSQVNYAMFETMYLTPKQNKSEDLKKGLIAHNQQWHMQELYKVWMYEVLLGEHEGQWLWAMGPCTFSNLDMRPDDAEHNQDWEKNVDPYVEKYSGTGYWKVNEKLSYPQEKTDYKMIDLTFYKVKPGQVYRFEEIFKKVVEVYKETKYPYPMYYYESQFGMGNYPEIVVQWQFDKWEYFDSFANFKKSYEQVFGDGSWAQLMKEYNDIVTYAMDEVGKVLE